MGVSIASWNGQSNKKLDNKDKKGDDRFSSFSGWSTPVLTIAECEFTGMENTKFQVERR